MEPFLVSAKVGRAQHAHDGATSAPTQTACPIASNASVPARVGLHNTEALLSSRRLLDSCVSQTESSRIDLQSSCQNAHGRAIGGESMRLLYERVEQFVLASLAIDVK